MYKGKSVGVVVPAFNESRFVKGTLGSVPDYVDKIYAVDDASTDTTLTIMLEQAQRDCRIDVIAREINGGVGASVVSGYKKALTDGIDIAVVMAGDGQMNPQYLPNLLDPILEGRAEYVKGNRLFEPNLRVGMSAWRYFGNVLLTYLNKIASGYWNVVDPQNGYTAVTARALGQLNLDEIYPRYAFENDVLVRLNVHDAKVVNVPIPAVYGEEESKIAYGSFIIRTSFFFLKAFFWRLWKKYLSKNRMGGPMSAAGEGDSSIVSDTKDSAIESNVNERGTDSIESGQTDSGAYLSERD